MSNEFVGKLICVVNCVLKRASSESENARSRDLKLGLDGKAVRVVFLAGLCEVGLRSLDLVQPVKK